MTIIANSRVFVQPLYNQAMDYTAAHSTIGTVAAPFYKSKNATLNPNYYKYAIFLLIKK